MTARAAAAGLALLAAASSAQERRPPTFSSQVELVTVDAVVLDGGGNLVRGLSAADFVLLEDGQPQPIASFEAFDAGAAPPATAPAATGPVATNHALPQPAGRPFVLLVDDMSLAPARQDDVRKAIARFVADGLRDGDEVTFATTSNDIWWNARLPGGRADLLALAERVRGRRLAETALDAISEWEAYRITDVEGMEDGQRGRPGEFTPADQGPPTGGPPPPPGAPGTNMTERVRQRFLRSGACDPLEPPSYCYARVRARAQVVDARRRARTGDVLAAVDRAVFALTGVRGRKSLLLLTEGFLSDPGLGSVQQVAGRCREANIAVYAVDVRGLVAGVEGMRATDMAAPNVPELGAMQAEEVDLQSAGSAGLAEDTGGFAVRNTNDLAGGAVRAASESRVYYLLGYAPATGKGPADWRRLKVEVKREGLRVRARRGYTLRSSSEIAAAAAAQLAPAAGQKPAMPPDVARAMANGRVSDAIPLRALAYLLEDRPDGTVRAVIAVEADTRSLANLGGAGEARATVSLSIASTHRDSGRTVQAAELVKVDAAPSQRWEGWLVLSRAFDVPPGVNQARVVVRDEFLGRMGTLVLRYEVPPPGSLRVSTPLITDRVTAARDGSPARPALVARREFAPVGPLYCQFQVYGAASVEASVELRHRDGRVVRRSAPGPLAADPAGRLTGFLAVPIDGIAQGEYDLVLRVDDKAGRTTERIEPLRISARVS